MQPPKAKRQRLPLTESTFLNPDKRPEMFEVKPDKVVMLEVKQDGLENMPAPKKDLSVRAKKPKPSERVSKGDGSIVLVRPYPHGVSLPCIKDPNFKIDDK